ncbi:molybdopterin molybdotransferase MoeA [Sphingomonas montana]|uniref:molybdopterin molybdotransferase MoeA n=1 Tax=Sphingomonas montana TaxID=1843236 RepID=UPI00096D5A3C|nr:molybdopterin molybdotransferase MoeA [Sphingomonas montana]
MTLLPVPEALARLLALAPALETEQAPLLAALDRTLAAPIHATRTQPAADLSAMDGYALRFAELRQPLTVTGEAAAGVAPFAIAPGHAARIFTGGAVPDGADVVLIQEEAIRDGDRLTLGGEGPPAPGAHIRRKGSDFTTGDLLLPAGTVVTPAVVALAAAAGHALLPVLRRPRIVILSTGDELVPPGTPATGIQLPSSNAPMLAALLARLPVEVQDRGIVRDDLPTLTAAFRDAAAWADIIVTTGGASVGDHDLVRPALVAAGAEIDFWRLALKPGKPLMAGHIGATVALGLPGNPISAYVTALLFLLPLAARLAGADHLLPPPETMPLATPLPATGPRREYVRAADREGAACPLTGQDSAALRRLPEAAVLVLRDAHSPPAVAGAMVTVVRIA